MITIKNVDSLFRSYSRPLEKINFLFIKTLHTHRLTLNKYRVDNNLTLLAERPYCQNGTDTFI